MKTKIDKILGIINVLILTGLVLGGIYIYTHWPKTGNPNEPTTPAQSQKEKPSEKVALPESFYLKIPFIVQAPLGDWSLPFNHTCEEAVVLTVHYFFQKKEPNDPVKLSREIQDLVNFQTQKYGFYEDTSAVQTAQLIKDYYGYNTKVYYDISIEDIKKELVKGNPIIVPTAGRLLGNPFFTPPGPVNHMLIIKGYNQTEFITNDPGTKRGADFKYSYQILENAIRDYGGDTKEKKVMIVVYPPDNY